MKRKHSIRGQGGNVSQVAHPHKFFLKKHGWSGTKIVISTIVVILAALLILPAAVPYLIPTSKYNEWLRRTISSRFDVDVAIDRFNFRLLPYPGYVIHGLRLISLKEPFQGTTLLSVEKTKGDLSLGELPRGRIQTNVQMQSPILDVRIEGGGINLVDALSVEGKRNPSDLRTDSIQMEDHSGSWEGKSIRGPDHVSEIQNDRQKTEKPLSPETPAVDGDVVIKSFEVADGTISLWREGGLNSAVEHVDLIADNIEAGSVLTAGIRSKGDMVFPSITSADGRPLRAEALLSGRVGIDGAGPKLFVRGANLELMGTTAKIDVSLNLASKPALFDINIASPSVNYSAFSLFPPLTGIDIAKPSSWQGGVAADITLKGTPISYAASIKADAIAAQLKIGDVLSKEPGAIFKTNGSFLVDSDKVKINSLDLTLGQNLFSINGEIADGIWDLSVKGQSPSLPALQAHFSPLSVLDGFDNLEMEFVINGGMDAKEPPRIVGNANLKSASIAGMDALDVKATIEYIFDDGENDAASRGGEMVFPTISARALGGDLSGHGSIYLGPTPGFSFDVVIDRVDAITIGSLEKSMSGIGSIVVNAKSEGVDSKSIPSNLILSGSLILPKATIERSSTGFSLTKELWQSLESFSGIKFNADLIESFEKGIDSIKEVNISFETARGQAIISPAVWKGNNYSAKLVAAIDESENIKGECFFIVDPTLSKQLIAGQKAKAQVINNTGELIIPMSLTGKLPLVSMYLDQMRLEKISSMIAGTDASKGAVALEPQKAPKEAQAKEGTEPKPTTPPTKGPETLAKKVGPAPGEEPKKSISGDRPAATKRPKVVPKKRSEAIEEDVEDILKVIIGR